jgi:hypothetical protein
MSLFNTNKLHAVAPILALTIGGLAGSLTAGDMTISAGKLARDAKDYYGKTVTVKAEVENVYDSRSFTLDEDSVFAGPDVLVLVPSGMTADLRNDQKVMVTGVVRQYVTSELERDFDWFRNGKLVTTKTDVDFKLRPVLVATSLMVDGRQMMTGGAMATTDHHVHTAKMAGDHKHDGKMADHKHDGKMADHKHDGKMDRKHDKMLSAGKLARDGKKYYGQSVTVRAEVEDVLDRHSFTLDEDSALTGADVVVLVPAGLDTSALMRDQVVVVTGKVRPYVAAELDRDFDWFKNGKIVTANREVEFKERPVLVADTITTVDGRTLISLR